MLVRIAETDLPNHALRDGLPIVESVSLEFSPVLFAYLAENYQEPEDIYEVLEELGKKRRHSAYDIVR